MSRATDFDFGANINWQDADNLAPWGSGTEAGGQERDIRTRNDRTRNNGHVNTKADPASVYDSELRQTGHTWNCECSICYLAEITCAEVKKMLRDITTTVEKANRQPMDLSAHRSSKNGRPKFENRDWLDSQKDLPKKGSSKWKVDSVREAKKNKTGIIAFVDLTNGSKKRVMSLRKGFTLDAFIEELGANTEKWNGKSISLERGGNEGQYINVAQ